MKATDYVIYRHGSNAANQPMTQTMPIGIYSGTGRTAAERERDAVRLAIEADHTVYNNQWLAAVPAARVSAEDRQAAWDHQQSCTGLNWEELKTVDQDAVWGDPIWDAGYAR